MKFKYFLTVVLIMIFGAASGQHQVPLYAPGNSAGLSTGDSYSLLSVTGQNAIGTTNNNSYQVHLGLLGPIRFVFTDSEIVDLGLNQLNQNYPNPFTSITTIPFEISRQGKVQLTLFNMLGQPVDIIVARKMPAGKHQIEFIGDNLSPGLFYYQLKVNGFQDTKSMVLTK